MEIGEIGGEDHRIFYVFFFLVQHRNRNFEYSMLAGTIILYVYIYV